MIRNVRNLTSRELMFLNILLAGYPNLQSIICGMHKYTVTEADDGGMGSLVFYHDGERYAGKTDVIVLAEFSDADGVKVDVSLTMGKNGKLAELDMWKVDFSKLISFPDKSVPLIFR